MTARRARVVAVAWQVAHLAAGYFLGSTCAYALVVVLGGGAGGAVHLLSRGALKGNPLADAYAAPAICLAAPILASAFAWFAKARRALAIGFAGGALLTLACFVYTLVWVLMARPGPMTSRDVSLSLGLASCAVAAFVTALIGCCVGVLLMKRGRPEVH